MCMITAVVLNVYGYHLEQGTTQGISQESPRTQDIVHILYRTWFIAPKFIVKFTKVTAKVLPCKF